MTKETEDYIQFVIEAIKDYQRIVDYVKSNSIVTPQMVNKVLANYGSALMTLTAEYQRRKVEEYDYYIDFQLWWDEKFTEIRDELNPRNISGNKWLSTREIESVLRNRYRNDYKEKKLHLSSLENKTSFYRQLIDNWKKLDQILVSITNNMRAEMKSLSLENRMNSNYSNSGYSNGSYNNESEEELPDSGRMKRRKKKEAN